MLDGIIPARAGFTAECPRRKNCAPDHPRSRGVYRMTRLRCWSSRGSSPLARGLPDGALKLVQVGRIIPARAGFTLNGAGSVYDVKDHPRSRGVYDATGPRRSPSVGSSPLARGLPKGGASPSIPAWIIPARAGFTVNDVVLLVPSEDHPRSRGVYPFANSGHCWKSGSSPLARGLRLARHLRGGGERIIPARAGFTTRGGRCLLGNWDHPRSRGVYAPRTGRPLVDYGSSPLARGLHGGGVGNVPTPRIIPARAGFTQEEDRPQPPGPDHPRSRGVYALTVGGLAAAPGSSPLARGLRPDVPRRRRGARIIPARAGFTCGEASR